MQTEVLKSNYRVISYDVRGFGESEASGEYSLDNMTQDLLKLMDHLQVKKAAVCGLSMGGSIALNAVEKFPSRFTALILSDVHCRPDRPGSKEEKLKTIASIREKGIIQFAEQSLRKYFASVSFHRRREAVKAARKTTTPGTADR